jgi:hypothetical protein
VRGPARHQVLLGEEDEGDALGGRREDGKVVGALFWVRGGEGVGGGVVRGDDGVEVVRGAATTADATNHRARPG